MHVGFFEEEVRKVLAQGGVSAEGARQSARAWWRRLPPTVDRYLEGESLGPFRTELRQLILQSIHVRFVQVGLLEPAAV